MPNGLRLGPLAFVVLRDDLCTCFPIHKHFDDTTLRESNANNLIPAF